MENSTMLPPEPQAETPVNSAGSAAPETSAENSARSSLPVTHMRVSVEVPPGTCVQVEIEARASDGRSLGSRSFLVQDGDSLSAVQPVASISVPAYPGALPILPAGVKRAIHWARTKSSAAAANLPTWLIWIAVGLYAFTRLVDLPAFPIYFFTDEAIQTVQAADLLRDHLFGQNHEFLPTYFQNGSQYNLSASVYLQALPYYFFGKSIWVTRGTAALMTLIAAICVGLTLKNVFKSPYPWLATLFLAITPAWFIHSRTAFETALATSFYAAFLYCYLMYRSENPRYFYGAIAAGGLAFYSYSAIRVVLGVSGLLLLISDFRYHMKHWKIVLRGLGLALLFVIPFIRFLVLHPDASAWQMRMLGSYWLTDISLKRKIETYIFQYLQGLDPFYWYMPNATDLARHLMLGYGHLLKQTVLLGIAGIGLALYNCRNSAYRTLLIAVVAVPAGAALVQVGITRVLAMVIPMALLTALATSALLEWLHRRKNLSRAWMGGVVFILLSGVSLWMLNDALRNGALWFEDYGLGGMQYGSRQLFGEIRGYLKEHPDVHLIVSPSWANGTDVIARFFYNDPIPFELGTAQGFYDEARAIEDNTVFVMIPEEFQAIPRGRFSEIRVDKAIPYPNGQPGFYFVRLKYVDDIGAVLQAEKEERRQLKVYPLTIDGDIVMVGLSRLDMGQPKDLFDGNLSTVTRSFAINPMQLTFAFPKPKTMLSVRLHVGGSATAVKVRVWSEGQTDPVVFEQSVPEVANPRNMTVDFQGKISAVKVEMEIKNINDSSEGNVHLWEVTFNP